MGTLGGKVCVCREGWRCEREVGECVAFCTHTRTHAHIHMNTRAYIYTRTKAHARTHPCVYTRTHMQVPVHECAVCTHPCVYTYTCRCLYMHAHVCTHMHLNENMDLLNQKGASTNGSPPNGETKVAVYPAGPETQGIGLESRGRRASQG